MKTKPSSPSDPRGKGLYPAAKVLVGIAIVIIVMAIGNWLLDKFPIWRWFK